MPLLESLTGRRRSHVPPHLAVDAQRIGPLGRATIRELEDYGSAERLAIGQAVNDAYAWHARAFPSRASFSLAARSRRLAHIAELARREDAWRDQRNEPLKAFACQLIRLWLLALDQGDQSLSSELGNVLARLAHEADVATV